MKLKIRLSAVILAAALMLCLLSGCSDAQTVNANSSSIDIEYSEEYGEWEGEKATLITLSQTSATVSGSGVSEENGVLTIIEKGTYVLSGDYCGQIAVNADKCKVRLVLNSVNISCDSSCPIYVIDAKEVTITLADKTVNTLTDSDSYTDFEKDSDEPNATIFSHDDLVFNGSGKLVINANYNNAIRSKDTLAISSGEYVINSVSSGISGKDSLEISGGSFDISCSGDALKSTKSDDDEAGWVSISGGSFKLDCDNDAIQAESSLSISGGDFYISTGGGSKNGEQHSDSMDFGGRPGSTSSSKDNSESQKGLKAGSSITISGGSFVFDCADDAIHSNGDISVSGGSFSIATGDDGFHADGKLSILGGTINITNSYEGLEGVEINISGGDIDIVASDDGVNSAGGNDSSGFGGMGREDMFAVDSDCEITISGGALFINASGDGIDSNGNVYITGGLIIINGPTDNGNGALDYSGECLVSGGILLAAGSSGMAQDISNGSSQPSMKITFSGTVPANTLIGILSSGGELVAAYAPTKSFSSFIYSGPGLVIGDEYIIAAEGECSGTSADGLYTSGEYTGYRELGTMVLSEPASSSHGMGGGMGHGMGGHR